MPEYLAPGVYVEETSFRAKSIEGVSTTTTGFVGPARFGPTDIEPELLTSLLEFERTYGDRLQLKYNGETNLTHNYLWHAVRAFFEEGGSRLYVSRVFQPKSDEDDGRSLVIIPKPEQEYTSLPDLPKDGEDSIKNSITVQARFPGLAGNNFRVSFTLKLGQNIFGVRSIDNKNKAFVAGLNDKDVVLIANKNKLFSSLDLLKDIGLETASQESSKLGLFIASFEPKTQTWSFTNPANSDSISLNNDNGEVNFENSATLEVRIVTLVVSVIRDDETQVWDGLPLDPSHHRGKTPDSVFYKFSEKPSNIVDARQLPIVITNRTDVKDGLNVLRVLNSATMNKGSLEFQVNNLCKFVATDSDLTPQQKQALCNVFNTFLKSEISPIAPSNIGNTEVIAAIEEQYSAEPDKSKKLAKFLAVIKQKMAAEYRLLAEYPLKDFEAYPFKLQVGKLCELLATTNTLTTVTAAQKEKLCTTINTILGIITPDNINTDAAKDLLSKDIEAKYLAPDKLEQFLAEIEQKMAAKIPPETFLFKLKLQVGKLCELVATSTDGSVLCNTINTILGSGGNGIITPSNINTNDTVKDLLVDAIEAKYSVAPDKITAFIDEIKTTMAAGYPNPDPFEDFPPKLQVSDLCEFVATQNGLTPEQEQALFDIINTIFGSIGIITPDNINTNDTVKDLLVAAIEAKYSTAPDKLTVFIDEIKTTMAANYPNPDPFEDFPPKLQVSDLCEFVATQNSLTPEQEQALFDTINIILGIITPSNIGTAKDLLITAIEKEYSKEPDKLGKFLAVIKEKMGNDNYPLKNYIILANYNLLLASLVKDWLDNDKPKDEASVTVMLDHGNDGAQPSDNTYKGEELDFGKTGLVAFEDLEDISIVAAPGSTQCLETDEPSLQQVQAIMLALISHAERMRYRIAVLDSVNNQRISEVRALRAKLDSKYAALYFPWIKVLDPVTRTEIALPPSGFVAGIYARNDKERAVYKAPANEVVRGALSFEMMLNKSQQEVLNPEGINCFRFFEGRGMRLWGARTISSDPEWKYVNLRRYFAYLERSIDKGTQWAVFEPNGDQLWANVRRTISDFLFNEWQNGALLGDKPEKSYFVKCDRSTMSQNDLDNGRLICLIGVAPLRPAEFVIFRIGQWTADRKV